MVGLFSAALSSTVPRTCRCEGGERIDGLGSPNDRPGVSDLPVDEIPPPKMRQSESFEEKLYRKFTKQPLVPIGCAATAYFLASGIKSFRDRDPVRSQRMMKYRVAAQFVTLMCFVGYVAADKGWDKLDLRLAPMYQDAKKARAAEASQQQQHSAPSSPRTSDP